MILDLGMSLQSKNHFCCCADSARGVIGTERGNFWLDKLCDC